LGIQTRAAGACPRDESSDGGAAVTPFTSKQALPGIIFAGLVGTVASAGAQVAPPDFSSHQIGWVGMNGGGPFFEPVPGATPGPVTTDPAHPFVPNGVGKQPTFRIADLTNPNLMPWVKEHMKKENDEVISGKKTGFTPHSSCQSAGVPMFMGYGGGNPIIFLQTPKEVWMYFSGDMQVRRVYMDVSHSANPKPSWYGESVGHYEGDTLVVDTIGLNNKTVTDIYRTPHTDKMHVVERWRMVNNGEGMESVFTVEDPGAFYQPWTAMRRYRRVQYDDIPEIVCAENNQQFDYLIPVAKTTDF
jgi:hypothetical protein